MTQWLYVVSGGGRGEHADPGILVLTSFETMTNLGGITILARWS
jgi:hypothetical protein